MKPAVEVSITSWKKNVVKPGQEYGRVLLMPGTGYNCDRPLLYWSAQALVEAGWRIDRMNVRNASDDLSTVIPVLNQAIDGWVAAARESGAGKAGDSGDGVAADDSATVLADGAAGSPNRDSRTPPPGSSPVWLIGKSLTTMTYPHVASHYGLPFVLLTPVLHHADFDPSARAIPVPAAAPAISIAESEAPEGVAGSKGDHPRGTGRPVARRQLPITPARHRSILRRHRRPVLRSSPRQRAHPARASATPGCQPFDRGARPLASLARLSEGSHRVRSPVRRHAAMPRDTPEFWNVAARIP